MTEVERINTPDVLGSTSQEGPVPQINLNVHNYSNGNPNHERTKRHIPTFKLLAAAAIAAVVVVGCNEAESVLHALSPHGTVDIAAIDWNKLNSVIESQDSNILTAEATGGVSMSADVKASWLFVQNFDFFGMAKENAGANIKTGINIVSEAGAEKLAPIKMPNGEMGVIDTVNIDKLKANLVDPISTPTGKDGFLINAADTAGISSQRNARIGDSETYAENTVLKTCADDLTQGQTGARLLAAAEVADTYYQIAMAAETTSNPQAKAALESIKNDAVPFEVIFTNNKGDVIQPSQVHLSNLPELIQPGTYSANGITINIAASSHTCQETPSARKSILEIEDSPNVTVPGLTTSPLLVKP